MINYDLHADYLFIFSTTKRQTMLYNNIQQVSIQWFFFCFEQVWSRSNEKFYAVIESNRIDVNRRPIDHTKTSYIKTKQVLIKMICILMICIRCLKPWATLKIIICIKLHAVYTLTLGKTKIIMSVCMLLLYNTNNTWLSIEWNV